MQPHFVGGISLSILLCINCTCRALRRCLESINVENRKALECTRVTCSPADVTECN